jgi:PAS domain S-box-containing protein
MKPGALLAFLGRSAGGWVALTISASVLVCASVVALQLHQDRSLARAAALVGDLRLARIDLYQGVMHSLLGDQPDSPWEPERGQVLIRQALREFRNSLAHIPDGPAADALELKLQQFGHALEAVHRTDPRAELDLRVALFRLNSAALQVDQQARRDLIALRQAQSRAYSLLLAVAAVLLGLISAAAVHLRRREAAAASAQRESELRFSVLFEQNPEPTLVHTEDRIELANPAALRALGAADVAALQSVRLLDLIEAADRERVAQRMAEQAEGPAPPSYLSSLVMRRLDGSQFSVEAATTSFRRAEGVRMLSVFRDVTARLAVERALAASERRLRDLIDLVPHGIYAKDVAGRYLLVNRTAARRQGCADPAEMLGRRPEEFQLLLQDAQLERQIDLGVLEAQQRHDGPVVVQRFAGTAPALAFNKIPFRFGGQEVDSVLTVATDVTERERALADAHTREHELERRVQQRTADLAQAYADLQTFSDAVSHDLRAPLAAMDTFADTVLRKYGADLAPQGRHYLERVLAGAASMRDMIDGLLELSRHARAPVHRRPLDFTRMAREAFELQTHALAGRSVAFVVEAGLQCSGDPVLVATLLQNLVGNAIKYSRHRERARIEVGARRAGEELQFYVRDNGAGFDPAYAGRLFKPFSRLHSADEFEGHGIGLATVNRIVARHGGRIWAEGAEGQGATFWFTLG